MLWSPKTREHAIPFTHENQAPLVQQTPCVLVLPPIANALLPRSRLCTHLLQGLRGGRTGSTAAPRAGQNRGISAKILVIVPG